MIPDPCREMRRKRERGPGRTRTRAGPPAWHVPAAHPDLVVDELAGDLHLLGGATDGEDPGVGVGGGRRVPLQLHMGPGLLVDALDGFTAWREEHASLPVHQNLDLDQDLDLSQKLYQDQNQSSWTHEELLVLTGFVWTHQNQELLIS